MTDEELVIFELAFHLKRSAYDIKYNMTYEEFIKWQLYFNMRPVDWRDDNRFMKILQSLGVKAKPEEVFQSLQQVSGAEKERNDRNELVRSLKGSVFFRHLLGATGGEKLDLLEHI